MTAAQMYNEFEIVYEAIASGDAASYEPYEISVLLTEAQGEILKELVKEGAEANDVRALVVGPFVKTEILTNPTTSPSDMYSDTYTFIQDTSDFWLIVGERLKETVDSSSVEVRPIDHEFWNANKDNPYKQPSSDSYFWRLLEYDDSGHKFVITGADTIYKYYISYLDKPDPIVVPGVPVNTVIDGTTVDAAIVLDGQDCVYNSIIHRDIVKRAAYNGAAYNNDTESFQLLKAQYGN